MNRKQLIVVLFCAAIFISQETIIPESKENKPPSIWGNRPSPAEFYGIQKEQRTLEPNYDKQNIRRKSEMQSDISEKFITIPSDFNGTKNFDVAGTPPEIEFAIVQGLEPWYLEPLDSMYESPMSSSAGFAIR